MQLIICGFFWRSGRRRRRSRPALNLREATAVARRQRVRLRKTDRRARENAARSRYSALKSEACWQDGGVADPATTRSPLR